MHYLMEHLNNTTTKPLNQNKMTPKEKAKELVDKNIEFTQEWNEIDGYVIDMYNATQCALIAVDEVLKASPSLPILGDSGTYSEDIELSTNYWQEVKQEIISNL